MTWSGGMPLGLFRGVRTLIWRSMPDLGPSFRQFADGLMERVERGS
jgi:hypothetical protein